MNNFLFVIVVIIIVILISIQFTLNLILKEIREIKQRVDTKRSGVMTMNDLKELKDLKELNRNNADE